MKREFLIQSFSLLGFGVFKARRFAEKVLSARDPPQSDFIHCSTISMGPEQPHASQLHSQRCKARELTDYPKPGTSSAVTSHTWTAQLTIVYCRNTHYSSPQQRYQSSQNKSTWSCIVVASCLEQGSRQHNRCRFGGVSVQTHGQALSHKIQTLEPVPCLGLISIEPTFLGSSFYKLSPS